MYSTIHTYIHALYYSTTWVRLFRSCSCTRVQRCPSCPIRPVHPVASSGVRGVGSCMLYVCMYVWMYGRTYLPIYHAEGTKGRGGSKIAQLFGVGLCFGCVLCPGWLGLGAVERVWSPRRVGSIVCAHAMYSSIRRRGGSRPGTLADRDESASAPRPTTTVTETRPGGRTEVMSPSRPPSHRDSSFYLHHALLGRTTAGGGGGRRV